MAKQYIIAIDGPTASGKGTIAEKLALKLGYIYLDTGAMYRALTFYCMTHNVNMEDAAAVAQTLNKIQIDFNAVGDTILNGEDVSDAIRSNEVSTNVSQYVSTYAEVREEMVTIQRKYAQNENIVIDGRDIGTVVFPQADRKFFITASLAVRAKRRYEQNISKGIQATLSETENMIATRDRTDIGRKNSPLLLAEDSIVIDSSTLTIDETLEKVLSYITWI